MKKNRFRDCFSKLNIPQRISAAVIAVSVPCLLALGISSALNVTPVQGDSVSASIPLSSLVESTSISESFFSSSEEESSSFEETESKEDTEIFLNPSSLEEDLEVQIVDAGGKLVTGYNFVLNVKGKDNWYDKDWDVDDGFLRLTSLIPGDYIVTLGEAEGYFAKENSVQIHVKEKIQYVEVDVTDKIVDESEIDVEKEDAGVSKPVATPEPTPAIPSYEDKMAEVTTEIVEYRYKINKISKGDFAEENIGYIYTRDGKKSKYIAAVDENGFLDGRIMVLKEQPASAIDVGISSQGGPDISTSELSVTKTIPVMATDIAESESAESTESQSTQTESTVTDSSSAESSSAAPSSSEKESSGESKQPVSSKEESSSAAPSSSEKESTSESKQPVSSKEESSSVTPSSSEMESSSESKQPVSSKEESSSVAPSSSEKESSSESKQPVSSKEESSSVAPSSSEKESSGESKQPVSSKEESSSVAPSSSEKESSGESKQPASSKEESSSAAPSSSEKESSSESKQPASSKEESSSAPQKKPGRDDCTNAAVYQKKNRDLLTEKVYNLLDISEAHTTRDTYKNGWNKDKTSYYLENGKPVKGQAIIGGMTFDFGSDGKIVRDVAKGIDVSKYQPNVDWAKVKASGVDFVIIRVGYRGYGSGVMVEDPCFKSHIAGARAAGLKVGVYFYSQAVTIEEAVEEASMALQLVEGYQLHYPIYFDTEATGTGHGRADNLSTTHRTAIANAFCQTVQNSGYKAGVYASKSWFMYQLDYSQIAKYDIWLAQYAPVADFAQRYDMWQYTGSGSVNGINGAVDLNWAYKVY